jgi:hypothetical protein
LLRAIADRPEQEQVMSIQLADQVLDYVGESIEIPESGYDTARKRYQDLSEWFGKPEAVCVRFGPHIYPQGSFRLGTVVRPILDKAEYDLDLGCRLRVGFSKTTHSQRALKELVGKDLEAYRVARRIREPLEEKCRCWRVVYADTMQFHMDTVPSIPETSETRQLIEASIRETGTDASLARNVANLTGAITDKRLPNYGVIDSRWRISNSEGYALWFESRMRLAESLLRERAFHLKMHTVDDLPVYRWNSPLQRVVQILKRHRDVMFVHNTASQPISVIITTLAGRAYNGERSVGEALRGVLATMDHFVNSTAPRVPNPVNPAEDFADKWYDAVYAHLKLEESFRRWLRKAQEDFGALEGTSDIRLLSESVNRSVGTRISESDLSGALGLAATGLLRSPVTPSRLTFPDKPIVPKKPAGFA